MVEGNRPDLACTLAVLWDALDASAKGSIDLQHIPASLAVEQMTTSVSCRLCWPDLGTECVKHLMCFV